MVEAGLEIEDPLDDGKVTYKMTKINNIILNEFLMVLPMFAVNGNMILK